MPWRTSFQPNPSMVLGIKIAAGGIFFFFGVGFARLGPRLWDPVGLSWKCSDELLCRRRRMTMVVGGCFRIDRAVMRGFFMKSKALFSKSRQRASLMVWT